MRPYYASHESYEAPTSLAAGVEDAAASYNQIMLVSWKHVLRSYESPSGLLGAPGVFRLRSFFNLSLPLGRRLPPTLLPSPGLTS